MFDRITCDSQIMGGRACIRGMRIPMSVIVSQVAYGASSDDVLRECPDLEREDISQVLQYAAWPKREQVIEAEAVVADDDICVPIRELPIG